MPGSRGQRLAKPFSPSFGGRPLEGKAQGDECSHYEDHDKSPQERNRIGAGINGSLPKNESQICRATDEQERQNCASPLSQAVSLNSRACYLYKKYFRRVFSNAASSSFQSATILSGGAPTRSSSTVAALPSSVIVFARSTLSGYSFFKTAAISSPMRIERTADFSPIFMLTPPHRCPAYKPETGISNCETNFSPGKCFAFSADATSSPFIHGAPKISNGASVPRPTEIPAFCKISSPEYKIAPFVVRKFGEGGTHRKPVLS